MDPDNGGVMSRSDFEESLSRAAAGEPLSATGSAPLDAVLQDVANSTPDSDDRAGAIEVAHLVFTQLDPEYQDDGIPWSGPACPSCGTEMNAEITNTTHGLKGSQRCPYCNLVLLRPDLFAT